MAGTSPAMTNREIKFRIKKARSHRPRAFLIERLSSRLLFRRGGRCRSRRRGSAWSGLALLALELLARLFGLLLKFFLELALLLLECLRIGRRAVIGLGEIGERPRQRDCGALLVDRQ